MPVTIKVTPELDPADAARFAAQIGIQLAEAITDAVKTSLLRTVEQAMPLPPDELAALAEYRAQNITLTDCERQALADYRAKKAHQRETAHSLVVKHLNGGARTDGIVYNGPIHVAANPVDIAASQKMQARQQKPGEYLP